MHLRDEPSLQHRQQVLSTPDRSTALQLWFANSTILERTRATLQCLRIEMMQTSRCTSCHCSFDPLHGLQPVLCRSNHAGSFLQSAALIHHYWIARAPSTWKQVFVLQTNVLVNHSIARSVVCVGNCEVVWQTKLPPSVVQKGVSTNREKAHRNCESQWGDENPRE